MALCIEDVETTALIEALATRRGVTGQEAVRDAVQAELDRIVKTGSVAQRLAAFHEKHPLLLGMQTADKAFFDELYGEP